MNGSGSPAGSSAADILLRRRNSPLPSPLASPSPGSPAPPPPAAARTTVAPDREVVEHFQTVSDRSQVAGYGEFQKEVGVLRKHISGEATVIAAALDSVAADGITKLQILHAIQDRIGLVEAEKQGAIEELGADKERDIASRRARSGEIDTTIAQIRAEIAQRETTIRTLTTEKDGIGRMLAEADSKYEDGVATLKAAADSLLNELRSQATGLQ